jgi:hypothetical protein
MKRSPLAAAVLEICDYLFDERLLSRIWETHRGRCYDDLLLFPDFLRLMRDALVNCGGSAHQLFVDLESKDAEPVNESSFYRKLSHIPVQLSRSLLRECTAKLSELMPPGQTELEACFDGFTVVAGDGKKIKNAAKRLKPTRGFSGKLIGAKALVAVDLRSGMALAMSDSLDGMSNDVPLVPELMDQLREVIPGPILSIWDRQFDDLRTMGRLTSRPGDAAVVRVKKHVHFEAESTVESRDSRGRVVIDQLGVMGKGKQAMRLRRISLIRGNGEEDVIVLTTLLDRQAFSAEALLELYKLRWGIEQVFQQVTETFSLSNLIGSSPKAVLLQFAYCLLLYNLVQLVKHYVADGGGVLASVVSTYYLFNNIRRELVAWAYHSDGSWPRQKRTAEQMRRRLRELLGDQWDPKRYTKAADRQPRPKPPPPQRLHGGHSSVQRVLEGKVKLLA